MDPLIFLPSVNWYLNNAMTVTETPLSYLIAYGTRDNVFLLTYKKNAVAEAPDLVDKPKLQMLTGVHNEYTTAVVFSPFTTDDNAIIATGGNDGVVKLWNVAATGVITELQTHRSHSGRQVMSMCYQTCGFYNHVVAGDEKGFVTCWDVTFNKVTDYRCGTSAINAVACSRRKAQQAALGTSDGLIWIINIDNGYVVQKMRGHDQSVTSLAWCPDHERKLSPSDHGNHLLASVSRDRTLRIWSGETGKSVGVAKILSSHGNRIVDESQKGSSFYSAVLWFDATTIYTSSQTGEIVKWDVTDVPKASTMHTEHNRLVFTISSTSDLIWSSSLDRQIVAWDINEKGVAYRVNSLGGYAYCIASSPVDCSRIAYGIGDRTVRICDTNTKRGRADALWNGVKGKVTALAWHPTKEMWLAFGTDEGRIAIFDNVKNVVKDALKFDAHHRRTVYTVQWGKPILTENIKPAAGYVLYSCGDGDILELDPTHPNAAAKSFRSMFKTKFPETNLESRKYTDLRWNDDMKYLALGSDSGHVDIIDPSSGFVKCIIACGTKVIQCIRWHPIFVAESDSASPHSMWIAVGSKDKNIKLYDLTPYLEGNGDSSLLTECAIVLRGHNDNVTGLCWSPHDDNLLLSVSYDWCAIVWNSFTGEALKKYYGHTGCLLCCLWSPVYRNVVITGGADSMVHSWDYKLCAHTAPQTRTEKQLKTNVKAIPVKREIRTGRPAVSVDAKTMDNQLGTAKSAEVVTKLNKQKGHKSLFSLSFNHENRGKVHSLKDCWYLYNQNEGICQTEEERGPLLGIYGGLKELEKTVEVENKNHKSNESWMSYMTLASFSGNLKEALDCAVKKGMLSDELIAMAPMVSRKYWTDLCAQYAQQLATLKDYHKAARYFVLSGKVTDAVDLLVSKNFFREAIVLVQCMLPEKDPKRDEVYEKWNAFLMGSNMDMAVKCFISRKKYKEALDILSKRDDWESRMLALALAKHLCLEDQLNVLIMQCTRECLSGRKYDDALAVVTQYDFKSIEALIQVHRELTTRLAIFDDHPLELEQEMLKWKQQENRQALLDVLLVQWNEQDFFKGHSLENLYNDFQLKFLSKQVPRNGNEVLLYISKQLALALFSVGDVRQCHILNAVVAAAVGNNNMILAKLLLLLIPQNILYSDGDVDTSATSAKLLKSAHIFHYYGILLWLYDTSGKKNCLLNVTPEKSSGDKWAVTDRLPESYDEPVLQKLRELAAALLDNTFAQHFQNINNLKVTEDAVIQMKAISEPVSSLCDEILHLKEDISNFVKEYHAFPDPRHSAHLLMSVCEALMEENSEQWHKYYTVVAEWNSQWKYAMYQGPDLGALFLL